MVSAQTKNALSQTFDIGVAKEICDNLDSNFGTSSIVGGSLDVSAGGITCGTITSSANVTAASGIVTGLAVVGSTSGSFGGVNITANGIVLPGFATGSLPGTPTAGQLVFDTTTTTIKFWNGSAWKSVAGV